jgi:hypothetical protein
MTGYRTPNINRIGKEGMRFTDYYAENSCTALPQRLNPVEDRRPARICQTQVSGVAVAPKGIEAAPFIVRVKLDNLDFVNRLPAGSAGAAVIYTGHLKPTRVVRRVILRQIAILNYINPF